MNGEMVVGGSISYRIRGNVTKFEENHYKPQIRYPVSGVEPKVRRIRNRKSKTLVNDQLDGQFIYFIIRLLQSSTCFEQRRAHHQEVKLY